MLDISMILSDNNRSKAYLQSLVKNNINPSYVILMKDDRYKLPEQDEYGSIIYKDSNQSVIQSMYDIEFDEKESIIETLDKNKVEYIEHNILDVNNKKIIDSVQNCPSKHIIFSGVGGNILKKGILSTGKVFIHVHPGDLPKYRGSTTIYYSMLLEENITCSVLVLNEQIDSGEVLYKKQFDLNKSFVDYDKVLDPIVRASTLVDFLKGVEDSYDILNMKNKVDEEREESNKFYIIHPLLKHIAITKTRR